MFHHSSDSSEGFTALRRHDEYYLSGGDLFFLIEQNHFRVHRYFFERESSFFKAQLATPASPGAPRQGTSESTAIVLDNVKSADFAKFLWVFYNPKYSLYKATVDDWVAILELATRWGFTEVKNLAVRELQRLEMSDLDRIVVYHKYDIDRGLLIPCYAALCEREAPLSLEEGMALGMDTTLKIFRAREIARAAPAADGSRSPALIVIPALEMKGIVKDLFEVEEPTAASPASPSRTSPSKIPPSKTPPTSKKGPITTKASTPATDSTSMQKKAEKTEPASSKKPDPPSAETKSETKSTSTGGLVARILSAACSASVTPTVPMALPTVPLTFPKTPIPIQLSPLQLSPLPLPVQPPREVSRLKLLEMELQMLAKNPPSLKMQEALPRLGIKEEERRLGVNSGFIDDLDGEDGSYQTLELESDDDETRVGSSLGLGDSRTELLQYLDDNTRGVEGPNEVDCTETALGAAHGQSTTNTRITGVDAAPDTDVIPPQTTEATAMNTVERPVEADDTDQTSYGPSDEMKGALMDSENTGLMDHRSPADYVSDVALDAVSHTLIKAEGSKDGGLLSDSSISVGSELVNNQVVDHQAEGEDAFAAGVENPSIGEVGCEKELTGLPLEGASALSSEDGSTSACNKTSEGEAPPSDWITLLQDPSNDVPKAEGGQDLSSGGEIDSKPESTDNDTSTNKLAGVMPHEDVDVTVVNGTRGAVSSAAEGSAHSDPLQSIPVSPPMDGPTQAASPEEIVVWQPGANFSFQTFGLSNCSAPSGEGDRCSTSRTVPDYLDSFHSASETPLPQPKTAVGGNLGGGSSADAKESTNQSSGEESSTTSQSSVESLRTSPPTQLDSATGNAQTSSGLVQIEEPAVPMPSGDILAPAQEPSEVQGLVSDAVSSYSELAAGDDQTNNTAQAEDSTPVPAGEGLPEKPFLFIDTTFLAPKQPDPANNDDQRNGPAETQELILEATGADSDPSENPSEAQNLSDDMAAPLQSVHTNNPDQPSNSSLQTGDPLALASDTLDLSLEKPSEAIAPSQSEATTSSEQTSSELAQTDGPTSQPTGSDSESSRKSESQNLPESNAAPQTESTAGDSQASGIPAQTSEPDGIAPASQTGSDAENVHSSQSEPEGAIPRPTSNGSSLTENPSETQALNVTVPPQGTESAPEHSQKESSYEVASASANDAAGVVSGADDVSGETSRNENTSQNLDAADNLSSTNTAQTATDTEVASGADPGAGGVEAKVEGHNVATDGVNGNNSMKSAAGPNDSGAGDGPPDAAVVADAPGLNTGAGTDVPGENNEEDHTSGQRIDASAMTVEVAEVPPVIPNLTAGLGDNTENAEGVKTSVAQAVLDLDTSIFDDESDIL